MARGRWFDSFVTSWIYSRQIPALKRGSRSVTASSEPVMVRDRRHERTELSVELPG